jgi:hypothetical protein
MFVFAADVRLSRAAVRTRERSRGCRKRSPAALHCFPLVLYNERRNSNVSRHQRDAAAARFSATSSHISFSAFKLAWPSLPTMRWSCTEMPSGRATSTIARVMSMSAREGVGSPEGWLCKSKPCKLAR